MKLIASLILLPVLISALEVDNYYSLTKKAPSEDAELTVPELVQKYGYPVEVHHVESQHGYILEVHRIPYGVAEGAGPNINKPVVFIQHGVLASSSDWIIAGPKKGLAYLLADLGFDVWMGNARGNTYSKKHKTLSPKDKKFWDFSWHEIGVYDLPAMIDHALDKTGQEKTFYIGHSQGNTAFYVMCAEKPEYNNKIIAQFSMAPVAFMKHMTSPLLKFISLFQGTLGALLNLLGIHEFLPSSGLIAKLGGTLCKESTVTQFLCTNTLFILCGFNVKQMNTELLPVIMGHTPAGSSTKQLLHFGQGIRSGKFRQYDFGLLKNLKVYKKMSPPAYDISKITVPVALYYSHNDWLAAEVDVMKLYNMLPNPIGRFLIADSQFNHLDFLFGRDVDDLVYNKVFSVMFRYL